jgi:integrase
MASITRTERKRAALDADGHPLIGPDGKKVWIAAGTYFWLVTYRDNGARRQEVKRRFDRKNDAQEFLNEITASLVTHSYVRPGAGRVSLREYTENVWKPMQTHRDSTEEQVDRHLRNYVFPAFGDKRLDAIRPSDAGKFLAALLQRLDPSTVGVIFCYTASIFNSAVRDRLIVESPFRDLRAPKVPPKKIRPPTTETVLRIMDAVPPRYRALVVLAAGTGLRQGELFGLTPTRVDFAATVIDVNRQLISVNGRTPRFGPLKTAASYRSVPLANVVNQSLAAHLEKWPPTENGLVFTNTRGEPLRRSAFGDMWRAALRDANLPRTTFHELRHYYASLLIHAGESVKAVQELLGHASATETLDTYAHLWPGADTRARSAVDETLGAISS